MPYIFYREDDRDLPQVRTVGFEAWVQLGLDDIRKIVTRFNGVYTAPILLQEFRAKWIADAVFKFNRKTLNLSLLGNLIKSKVDQSSIQISTGITQDGGGRSKKHLFKITCPKTIYMVDLRSGIVRHNPASLKVMVKTQLVMDAPKLADAKLIALAIQGGEVAFLTKIPGTWISKVW